MRSSEVSRRLWIHKQSTRLISESWVFRCRYHHSCNKKNHGGLLLFIKCLMRPKEKKCFKSILISWVCSEGAWLTRNEIVSINRRIDMYTCIERYWYSGEAPILNSNTSLKPCVYGIVPCAFLKISLIYGCILCNVLTNFPKFIDN